MENVPYALVVDDVMLIRMDACDILEDAGFRPLDSADADQAIATLTRLNGDISLLFTDVQMPTGAMDGFALARVVAKRWPDIAIIVASGMLQPQSGEMPEGARFIAKPFSADVVYEVLQELLPEQQQPPPLREKHPDGSH